MNARRYSAVIALFVFGLAEAQASPFDVHGPTSRSAAMGGAQVASPEGAGATYDNVAGLAGVDPELRVGAFATLAEAPILLMPRPDGYDVPSLSGSDAVPSDQTRRPRQDGESPGPLYGVVAGVVTDFGGTNTRGGVLVMLPTNGLLQMRTHFADERERHFSNQLHHEVIGDRLHRPVIELGVARHLTENLAFGVGGTYMPAAVATTEAFVWDPSDQSQVDLNADVATGNSWGLLAGLVADMPLGLRVGLAFRGAVAFDVEGGNEVQVRGVPGTEEQTLRWRPLSTPSSLRGGVARSFGDFEVTLDGRWTFWSSYLDTQAEPAGFSDTIEGRLGLEWLSSEDTRLRAGAGFIPSPVPEQSGRTNYVDNHRILGTLGGGHQFRAAGREFEASWFVQVQHLLRRETHKEERDPYPVCGPGERGLCDEVPDDTLDPRTGQPYPQAQGLQTGNPGFPGFVSGGWIGALGMEVRY